MSIIDNELNELLLEDSENLEDEYFEVDGTADFVDEDEEEWEYGEADNNLDELGESSLENYEVLDESDFEGDLDLVEPGYEESGELAAEADFILSPDEEEEMAYELITIESEAELEEFLGKLIGRGVKKIGKRILPSATKYIRGASGKLLSRALPIVGSAAGSIVPGFGTTLGGAAGGVLGTLIGGGGRRRGRRRSRRVQRASPLAALLGGGGNPLAALLSSGLGGNVLGKLLGGEMEHSTLDEAKFDLAKRVVRSVAQGTAQAVTDPRAVSNPDATARAALKRAIRQHIPSPVRPALVRLPAAATGVGGHWVRRGDKIVVIGA